jgi:hypothetical protein
VRERHEIVRAPFSRAGALRRGVALLLSWAFTATTVWASAPPVVSRPGSGGRSGSVSLAVRSRRGASLASASSFAAAGTSGHGGDDRDDRKGHGGNGDRDGKKSGDRQDSDHETKGDSHGEKGHGGRGGDDDRDRGKDDDRDALVPLALCVADRGQNRYEARFGYENRGHSAVQVPYGRDNRFSPGPERRGQPVKFLPGRADERRGSSFRVEFDGEAIAWELRGRDGVRRSAVASKHSPRCATPPPPDEASCDVRFWGPRRFTRTCGKPDEYEETIALPAWISQPHVLRVVNGEPDGRQRVSSARIEIDGATVAGPSDFSMKVAGFDREVTLRTESRLEVRLESGPGSFLQLSLCGGRGDRTAPVVAWAQPAPGSATNDKTPHLALTYEDPVGGGEPGASGADPSTLAVTLDGVDRTALFTRRPGDASADLPDALALEEGAHHLEARIADRAGNESAAVADFRVDTTPPSVAVSEPAAGAYHHPPVGIRIPFGDESALAPGALSVVVNGVDRTALFGQGQGEAVATLDLGSGLVEGPNQIEARVRDGAGNEASAAVAFNVDNEPPTLVIGQPAPGARLGSGDVEVLVEYRDDQALDPDSFEATVDGAPVVLGRFPGGATGWIGPLADGDHRLVVGIRDRAGNAGSAKSLFTVDA